LDRTPVIDPIAFSIGPFDVHWYGLILGTAVLVGLAVAVREGKRFGLDPDLFLDLLLYGVPLAILGARAYYVLFRWDYYSQHPGEIIAVWKGGLAIHGALIAAVLTAYVDSRGGAESLLEAGRPCRPQPDSRPGHRTVGQFREPGGPRRAGQPRLSGTVAPAGLDH
jgi:Prolipoprotein diacylglyceryltransferase